MSHAGPTEAGCPAHPATVAPGELPAHLEVLVLLLRECPLGHHERAQAFAGHVPTLGEHRQVTGFAWARQPPTVTTTASPGSGQQTGIAEGAAPQRLQPVYGGGAGGQASRHRPFHHTRASVGGFVFQVWGKSL